MNRREFLQSLVAAGTLVAAYPEKAIEQFLTETKHFNDDQFLAYVEFHMNLWVSNPAHCVILHGITE